MGTVLNPWKVMSLDEFLFYCCPECDEKSQDYTQFFNHAILMHDLAKETLGSDQVKLEKLDFDLSDENLENAGDEYEVSMNACEDFELEESLDPSDFIAKQSDENLSDNETKVELDSIKHENSNSEINVCEQCGKRFITMTKLRKHMKVVHKINSELPLKKQTKLNLEDASVTCEKCGKKFASMKTLQRHQDIVDCSIDLENPHVCDHCKKSFNTKTKLKMHKFHAMCLPPDEQDLKCKICETQCSSEEAYRGHMRKMHENPRIPCELCNNEVIEERWEIHRKNCEKVFNEKYLGHKYQCDQCKRSFESQRRLTNHKRNNHNEQEWKCDDCGKTFQNRNSLSNHKRSVHKEKEFNCHICDQDFPSKGKFKYHMKMLHPESMLTCEFCKVTFFTKEKFEKHQCDGKREATKGSRPEKQYFDCEVCDAKLLTVIELKDHMVVFHQSSKIYCEFCGKHVPTQNFFEHVETCIVLYKEKYVGHKYQCTKCRRSYDLQTTFNSHNRAVHRKVRYPCKQCGQDFASTHRRKMHEQVKHEGLLFYCQHCGQSFNTTDMLRYHLAKNHDQGPKFYCDQCPEWFVTKRALVKHNCEAVQKWKLVEEKRRQKRELQRIEQTNSSSPY